MNDFEKAVKDYYNCKIYNDENKKYDKKYNRFLSWEHCYEYFYTLRKNIDYDKAALMLFCYLASWGMLRNSFLIDYDYKLFIGLIEKLIPEYNDLWNSDANSWELVQKADNTIIEYFKEYKNNKEQISETLRTKILLGIFGCTPAYDRYFKKGISKYNNSNKNFHLIGKFSNNSYFKLWNFYNMQVKLNLKLHNNSNILYPPMKLVDMYFWQIGQ